MILIDGKQISASLKEALRQQVSTFPQQYGRVPHLVVVRVGEDPASVVYVRNKAKACEACGIRNTTLVLDENIPEAALLEKVRQLNADDSVDGILVQLPLPRHISEAKVIETIARMEHDEYLHEAEEAEKRRAALEGKTLVSEPQTETAKTVDEKEDNKDKKTKKRVIDLKKIVTSFTEFFTPDNIE